VINWIQHIDMQVLLGLVALRSAELTRVMILVSDAGEWVIVLIASIGIALGLYIKKWREEAAGLLVATLGSAAAALLIKDVVARARPDVALRAVAETGYSFPSAHATLAVAFFGFLAYLIGRKTTASKTLLLLITVLICLLIGFSRLYLGVHYFSDVLGGYVLGAIFLTIGIKVERWLTNRAAS